MRPRLPAGLICVAAVAIGAGCASRGAAPVAPAAGRAPSPGAHLASARAAVDDARPEDAVRPLDALLATPVTGRVRAEALELAAFLRLDPAAGQQDLPAAKALLIERRQLPLAPARRVELDAVLTVVDLAMTVRTELSAVQATLERVEAERAREAEQHDQQLSDATRAQRQLRAQVQSLKADVDRLEKVIKNVTAGLVGRKPGGR